MKGLSSPPQLFANGPAFDAAGLVHRVRRPDAPGPHRTAVMLHGRSGDEDVMWVFASTVPDDWLIVAPRAIQADPDGDYSWHPRRPDAWPSLIAFDEAVAALVKFIRALPALYQADPDHVYLMGFSQGAALAYAVALRHPGLVKGVAGLVGFTPEGIGSDQRPLEGLPVFMAAGTNDPRIPLVRSRASAGVLRQAGAALEYNEYDTEHKLTPDAIRDLRRWWQERA